MATIIKPTIGRVVWFHPATNSAEGGFYPAPICAAIVAYVHSDSCVNLAVFDANGNAHSKCSVALVQDGEAPPENGYYAEWMPYQKGQAAKHDEKSALELGAEVRRSGQAGA